MDSPSGDTEVLFREAKQRRRRRRLLWVGLVVVVVVGAVAATVASGSNPRASIHRPGISAASASKSAGLPVGPIVALEHAGPLAVGPTGALFVVDEARRDVLVHLSNGQFRVVAGDGKEGFSGSGGPATRAELANVSDMAFGPNGDLYLADGGRVQVVDHRGVIKTIAGDGQSGPPVVNGEPALLAALGPEVTIALSPSGGLYLATQSQLLRLSATNALSVVPAIVTSGPQPGSLGDFGQIAVDAQGNVYASSLYTGWSVYKISPDGTATELGYARRSGGNVAVVERGVGGAILADDGSNVVRADGDRLVSTFSFGKVPGISTFQFLNFFAVAPNGTLYADDLGPPAFEPYQQIVSVAHGHAASLWQGRTHR
jgi:glucose/arabinose dehydrogenase